MRGAVDSPWPSVTETPRVLRACIRCSMAHEAGPDEATESFGSTTILSDDIRSPNAVGDTPAATAVPSTLRKLRRFNSDSGIGRKEQLDQLTPAGRLRADRSPARPCSRYGLLMRASQPHPGATSCSGRDPRRSAPRASRETVPESVHPGARTY